MADISQNIQYLKGVGPARAELLNKVNINTVEDAIYYFPREYEDRGIFKKICELQSGENATFKAIAVTRVSENRIRKGMTIYKLIVRDDTGSILITWFNQTYIKDKIRAGEEYIFYGKVTGNLGRLEVASPVFDEAGQSKNTGKIIPIYPLTYGLTQNVIRSIIETAVNSVDGTFEETLSDKIRNMYDLCDINYAIKNIHFPSDSKDFEKARYRIAFEELLVLQLALWNVKSQNLKEMEGIEFSNKENMEEFKENLPFSLTKAQARVWEEIKEDMESSKSMNRLVQGDVGSGKTVVAAMAMYKTVKNGYQATMMAPTSILANQHYESISKMLGKFGITCGLFTSNLTKKQKENLINELREGRIDIAIGTHALIEENIEFKNLGLVITDEQHRFGVRQRSVLSGKGNKPDVLVMTATPIPRTLALILYGDLDISAIDELPLGRQRIDTYAVTKSMDERVNEFIKKEVKEGRQAYVVCSLVEESEVFDAKSVKEMEQYYKDAFKEFNVQILHGKMKNKEKDEIMQKYKNKEIDILVSTTVIEVGVDVPNATMMVVENAERFGLAQLHQLRGRVGRGKYKSYCILKYESKSPVVKKRMDIMQQTNDGFVISEKDLELRGPGDFFGIMQHGLPEFKVANLYRDTEILRKAQIVAKELLREDPNLQRQENIAMRGKMEEIFDRRIEL